MFRNVSGSIGISITTSQIVERTQIRTAHLADHMSYLDQGFSIAVRQYGNLGALYQTFVKQGQILAYSDLFVFAGIGALCVAPIALLLSSKTGGGQQNAAH